jgi:copper chaperone NosL
METKVNKISVFSRTILVISAIALVITIYVPIWRIELEAPQYPEGLNLKIHADKIAGNIDIINGLNHYIGMKTLHSDDFIEFTILPYLIGFFALFTLAVAVIGRKKILYILLFAFILFGVVAMADFWRWEYNYGHDLDPNAAIIVPGMAYQPPLIGYKQLLNFGAYSIPDKGGWLMIISGILILFASTLEFRKSRLKMNSVASMPMALLFICMLNSCQNGPQPIKLNVDNCGYCEMTISDRRFATELITKKGRIYKFDDLSCMLRYMKENKQQAYSGIYISDYLKPNDLIRAEHTFIISGELLRSPMRGNMAAFSNRDSARSFQERLSATPADWAKLKP